MEFTTFSLPGKVLTALYYLGPRGEAGLDGRIHDEESVGRTAAALGRVVGMRGNNIDKPLRELEKEGHAERTGETRGRGCRWRVVNKGLRTARRLWDEDLTVDVLVGQARIPVATMIDLLRDKYRCEKTPEGLMRFVVDRGWLPYLHSPKQNSQRSRDGYDPFGYASLSPNHNAWSSAIEVTALAVVVLLEHRTTETLGNASSIVFALLHSRPDQVSRLVRLASRVEALGTSRRTIKGLLELLGSTEVPDKNLRVASYEALLRIQRVRHQNPSTT